MRNVEEKLQKEGKKLPGKARTPMSSKRNCSPELDVSDELDDEDTNCHQELVGILRWAVELGRVDILHEVALLSQFQASPREGHMEEMLHIFAFLKQKPKMQLTFSHEPATLPEVDFKTDNEDLKDHCHNAQEELLPDMPEPRG